MNYANNAYSVIDGAITNVATTIQLAAGTGSRFPASDFMATLIGYDVSGNENAWEIVSCSSRAGDVLTVTRGQEGTTAVAWANGARIENRVTAGTMAALEPTIAAGTTSQYWRGDKSWRDFFTDVRAATLTGLSAATNAAITAADTVLGALGKLQKQITDNLAAFTSHAGSGGAAHANATTSVAGFMSSADKTKVDYLDVSYGSAILSVLPTVADANADLKLSGKGAGVVRFGGAVVVLGDGAASAWESGANNISAIQFGDSSAVAERSVSGVQTSYYCINAYFDGASWKYKTTGPAGLLQVSTAGMNFRMAASGSAGAAIAWSQYLTSNTIGQTYATAMLDTKVTMAASSIDLAAGNYFSKTIAGATTLTVSNIPAAGLAANFILDLTNGGSATITWFSGVKWAGGAAPTLTASGRDVLGFFTHDGGTTWTGLLLGRDVK